MVKALPECKLTSPFQFRVFSTGQQEEWMEVLGRVAEHDFYHLPQYQRVEERRLEATAHLFTYCEGDYLVALPLLLRFDGRRANGMERCHVGLWLRRTGGLTREDARACRAPFSSGV